MTEFTSEGVVKLSTRGSLLQVLILLYSFPSHWVHCSETYLAIFLFGSVGLCGFGLLVAGFLEVLSGGTLSEIMYVLPALCCSFHLGHSQWPEDRAYSCVPCNMDVTFKIWEDFKIQKNIENYIIVPSFSTSQCRSTISKHLGVMA